MLAAGAEGGLAPDCDREDASLVSPTASASQLWTSTQYAQPLICDALAVGETERRVFAITVWRETPFFTGRQRAALELTEAMTRLVDHPIPDQVIDHAAARFSTRELAELIWVITVINAWNRLGATARPWPLA